MVRFFLYSLIITISLFGEELSEINEFEVSDVTATDGLPSSLVQGHVCAISGEYVDFMTDFTVQGPETLCFSRTYGNKSNPFWSNNHLEIVQLGTGYYEEKKYFLAGMRVVSGGKFNFKQNYDSHYKKKDLVTLNFVTPEGLCNGGSLQSARHHPKHRKIHYYPKEKKLTSVDSNGESSIYLPFEGKNGILYRQKELKKRNGSSYDYRFADEKKRTKATICCRNQSTKREYSHATFETVEETLKSKKNVIHTSDGQSVSYDHFCIKEKDKVYENGGVTRNTYYNYYLSRVSPSFSPPVSYNYRTKATDFGQNIVEKKLPNGRHLRISYYGKEKKEKDTHNEYRLDRVHQLKAPVGTTSSSVTTHTFDYHCKREKGKLLGGYTNVFNAYSNKTRYNYNKEHRLTSIERFTGRESYKKYSEESFVWGGDGSEIEARILFDKSKKIHHAQKYIYDSAGNLRIKKTYGSLTGNETPAVSLDVNGKPIDNGCECETEHYYYSDDELHLLIKEIRSSGETIIYRYIPGTEIKEAQFILVNDQIKKREFYSYNQNFSLVEKIVDDGSSFTKNDLTNANERHVTVIEPQTIAPIGLPKKITEFYLDFNTHTLIPLQSKECDYSRKGLLLKERFYDSAGNIAYTLEKEYDAHGNITLETDPLGQRFIKRYDENDNLIFSQGPSYDYWTENTYDFSNRLIRQDEIHHNGPHYVHHFSYDYLGQCIKKTNAYGQETHQLYDDNGRLIEVRLPPVVNETGAFTSPTIRRKYNVAGYPTKTIDPRGLVTQTTYTIRGQPLKITHPDGSQEQNFYRIDGQLIRHIDRAGTHTIYERDYQGRITKEQVIASTGEILKEVNNHYSTFHLLSTKDSGGQVTDYKYDWAGRLEYTLQGNKKTQNCYDSLGRVGEVREWFGSGADDYRSNRMTYDLLNRVVEERLEDSTGTIYQKTTYEYDVHGNKTVIQEGPIVTKTIYNAHNQPIKIIDGAGQTTVVTYNTCFFNGWGQYVLQTVTTDPLGNQIIDIYDAADRIVETIRRNSLGEILAHEEKIYDLVGNLCKSVNHVYQGTTHSHSVERHLTYTVDSQIAVQIEANGTHDQKITRFQYNTAGQLIAHTKPDGIVLSYDYDGCGRVARKYSSDRSIDYAFTYDHRDNVISATDLITGKATTRVYNSYNHLTQEIFEHGLSLEYQHDLLDRLCEVTLPDDTGIDYLYNAIDLKKINRKINQQISYSHHNEEYDLSGKIVKAILPGKIGEINYLYDSGGRHKSIISSHHSFVCQKYDAVGNLLHYTLNDKDQHIQYDSLYQVKNEEGHFNHLYTFDSLANRTEKDGESHHYDFLNQLLKKGKENFSYDPNGNMVEGTVNGVHYHFSYDALDRLVAVEKSGETIHYSYDAFNRRIRREKELFFYQGNDEIGRMIDGTIDQLKIIGKNQGSQAIAIELTGKAYVPLHDLAGNIIHLISLDGSLAESYRYTTFGECEALSFELKNPWMYAGRRCDPETGFIAFALRYYAPTLGRWITTDPAGFGDGANLYAYVRNNPLRYFDQLGLFALPHEDLGSFRGISRTSSSPRDYRELGVYSIPPPNNSFISSASTFLGISHECNLKTGWYNLNENFIDPGTNSNFALKDERNIRFVFENGISNTFEDFSRSLMYMGQLTGSNVHGVYSPTRGFLKDGLNYLRALNGQNFPEMKLLQMVFNDFFMHADPGASLLCIAHSRGAVYVRNTLMTYPEDLCQRIKLLLVAPGGYTPQGVCKEVTHLVSSSDPIPRIDFRGRQRCKNTTIILEPHRESSGMDHNFTSKTYREKIEQSSKKYINESLKLGA